MPEDPSQPKSTTEANEDEERALASVEAQNLTTDTSVTNADVSSPVLTESSSSGPVQSSRKSKKGLFIGLAVAGTLAVLGGGSAFAYTWYQNPEKVVADGILSAVYARTANIDGTMEYTTKDIDGILTFSNRGGMQDGAMMSTKLAVKYKEANQSIEIEGDGIYAKNGDVYFRVKKLKSAFDKFVTMAVEQMVKEYKDQGQQIPQQAIAEMQASYKQHFQPLVTKVDNQWIKVSAADLQKTDEQSSEEYKCVQDNLKKLYSDNKTKDQVVAVYQRNKFLVVKEHLGLRDGSLGYVIEVDDAKLKKFNEEFKQTQIYKDLQACSKDDSGDTSESDVIEDRSSMTGRVELWMDQWTHALTRVKGETTNKVDGEEQKMKLDFTTKFNQPTRIALPEDVMTIDQLKKEIEDVTENMFGSQATSPPASRA